MADPVVLVVHFDWDDWKIRENKRKEKLKSTTAKLQQNEQLKGAKYDSVR